MVMVVLPRRCWPVAALPRVAVEFWPPPAVRGRGRPPAVGGSRPRFVVGGGRRRPVAASGDCVLQTVTRGGGLRHSAECVVTCGGVSGGCGWWCVVAGGAGGNRSLL